MKPCTRIGVNVTKRCNWRCKMCFYRWSADFNKAYEVPLEALQTEITGGKKRGCDHVVLVGWGEPTLYRSINDLMKWVRSQGMTSSMITNGMITTDRAESLFQDGLDHFHVSVHGLGNALNNIAGVPTASANQERFKEYLRESKRPWRSNTTPQLENYKTLPAIVSDIIEHGAFHVVLLGFLPHGDWHAHAADVAVHPAVLRPYLETCLDLCLKAGVHVTLRYQPMCHINPKYWPYVTNARYVLYDPWEWEYDHAGEDPITLWQSAIKLSDEVSIKASPCKECSMWLHCGGWHATYAKAFNGANLQAIPACDLPTAAVTTPGYYFDQNPANALTGCAP